MGLSASAAAGAALAALAVAAALTTRISEPAPRRAAARLVSMQTPPPRDAGCNEALWISMRRMLGAPPPQGSAGEVCR